MKKAKGTVFVEHIEKHLENKDTVICTLCGKTVDQIYEEYKKAKA